jgi:hypothetical protein
MREIEAAKQKTTEGKYDLFKDANGKIMYLPQGAEVPEGATPFVKEGVVRHISGQSGTKEPKSTDRKRLGDMVSIATKNGKQEPSASDILLINKEAETHGLEFKKVVTGKTDKRHIPGTNIEWGGEETGEWRLVDREGGQPESKAQPPAGFTDSGKTSGGKKVYVKGNQAWVEP